MPVLGVPEQRKTHQIGPSVVNRSKMQCARKTAQDQFCPIQPSNVTVPYRRLENVQPVPRLLCAMCNSETETVQVATP